MQVTLTYVDTCTADYLTDHCNGDSECLIGVDADNNVTAQGVYHSLLRAFDSSDDSRLELITDSDFRAALIAAFEGVASDYKPGADLPDDEGDGESPAFWYRVAWIADVDRPSPLLPWKVTLAAFPGCEPFNWKGDALERREAERLAFAAWLVALELKPDDEGEGSRYEPADFHAAQFRAVAVDWQDVATGLAANWRRERESTFPGAGEPGALTVYSYALTADPA